MLSKQFVRHTILFVAILKLWNITAEPLRAVRDVAGDIWEEYFDERTQHFYYFNIKTNETSWLLEFSKKGVQRNWASDDENIPAEDVINEMFPVQLSRGEDYFETLGIFPTDLDDIYLRKDMAGKLHNQHVKCMFDHLIGVQARVNYPMALKAPVAFHHMFVSDEKRQEYVAKERKNIEERLLDNPENAEDWETLGHVWRVYGNVHRAMDCYRRALEIAPYEKSSFYINIAGLLDQMNYIQDALEVLDVMMVSFDVFTSESESNLALGYVMASQLHVRNKNSGNLTLASEMIDAALALHPQFFNAIFGLRQEIHYKNYSFGGPPWLFGGTGSWGHLKLLGWASTWLCFNSTDDYFTGITCKYPLLSLFVRKCVNACPALLGGLLTRVVMIHGSYLPVPLVGITIPVIFPISLCLHLTLSTEYFLSDSVLLLIVGYMISHESVFEKLFLHATFPILKKKSR